MTNTLSKETLDAAFEAGKADHIDGKTATPCHSKRCMQLVGANNGHALAIMTEWQYGWTWQNLGDHGKAARAWRGNGFHPHARYGSAKERKESSQPSKWC